MLGARLTVGNGEIWSLNDNEATLPLREVFPEAPAGAWALWRRNNLHPDAGAYAGIYEFGGGVRRGTGLHLGRCVPRAGAGDRNGLEVQFRYGRRAGGGYPRGDD